MYGNISGSSPRKKLDISDIELSVSRPDRFIPGEIFPGTNWTGGREDHSACSDAME
jgi:hypothetical protein